MSSEKPSISGLEGSVAFPTILPVIALNNYDPFRRILRSHIADTYDEWLDLFAQWEQEWGRNGAPIRRVNVNARDFERHLATTGHAPTLNELFVFAAGLADKNRN
jgi:hypothetical protein